MRLPNTILAPALAAACLVGLGLSACGRPSDRDGGPPAATAPATPPSLPITGLVIPDIPLEAEVVPAPLTDAPEGRTWEVPPFKAGHAAGTPGPGRAGNAVVVGHVASDNAGNVFQDLGRVRVGEPVLVSTGDRVFEYRVVEARPVPRTEVSVLQPTEVPTLTLITCAGEWLPELGDYAERLVVRAELVADDAPGDGRGR